MVVLAMVINGTAKVDIGLKDLLAEELQGVLSQAIPSSQVIDPENGDMDI